MAWGELETFNELRKRIAEETTAISNYDTMRENIDDTDIKDLMMHISKEEKMHLAELYKILEIADSEQEEMAIEAMKDIEE